MQLITQDNGPDITNYFYKNGKIYNINHIFSKSNSFVEKYPEFYLQLLYVGKSMFLSDNMLKEEYRVEINTIMSSQIIELQQTVQMTVMQSAALNLNTVAAVDLLEDLPQQQVTVHPYKGSVIDISI